MTPRKATAKSNKRHQGTLSPRGSGSEDEAEQIIEQLASGVGTLENIVGGIVGSAHMGTAEPAPTRAATAPSAAQRPSRACKRARIRDIAADLLVRYSKLQDRLEAQSRQQNQLRDLVAAQPQHQEQQRQAERDDQVATQWNPHHSQEEHAPQNQEGQETAEAQEDQRTAEAAADQGFDPGEPGPSTQITGIGARRSRARVMIVGHSFIYWAAKHAAQSSWGQHLGLSEVATLEWRGYRGMRWSQVLPTAVQLAQGRPPDILVIHAGGNDLGRRPGKDLILAILADLQLWHQRFPAVRVLWSTIIPRRAWVAGINRARRGVNQEVARAIRKGRGGVIGHPDITPNRPELFRADGVHLSEMGMQLFLDDLHRGLLAALVGPRGEAWP